MTIRLIRVPFLIPTWAAGQVLLPRTIFYVDDSLSKALLAHELVHVIQIRTLGLWAYWTSYLSKLVNGGYGSHPMEEEAYHLGEHHVFMAYGSLLLDAIRASNKRVTTVRLDKRDIERLEYTYG